MPAALEKLGSERPRSRVEIEFYEVVVGARLVLRGIPRESIKGRGGMFPAASFFAGDDSALAIYDVPGSTNLSSGPQFEGFNPLRVVMSELGGINSEIDVSSALRVVNNFRPVFFSDPLLPAYLSPARFFPPVRFVRK